MTNWPSNHHLLFIIYYLFDNAKVFCQKYSLATAVEHRYGLWKSVKSEHYSKRSLPVVDVDHNSSWTRVDIAVQNAVTCTIC